MKGVTIRAGIGWERVLAHAIMSERPTLPPPWLEYVFAPPRRWRFDLAWPQEDLLLALEIDGGAFPSNVLGQGRHTRGLGFIRDHEKLNAAALLGWRILHCTPRDVQSGAALLLVKRAFA